MAHSPHPEILYEDERVLVLNKPARLVVHGDGRTNTVTLSDWLVAQYPALASVGEPWEDGERNTIPRPGIVHRLDKETSGVMVVAKTQNAFEHLKQQFQERTVAKTYRAFAYDAFKEPEGEIERPIGRSASDFRKRSAQPGARGELREAHTHYQVLGEVHESGHTYTYLELRPTTGRMHQLRVHLKAIHHPIVCDSLYAPRRERALGFERLALHAHTLTLTLLNGEQRVFEALLPDDFEHAVALVEALS